MKLLEAQPPHDLSYQSRIGAVHRLKPDTVRCVGELAAQGVRNLLVVPMSFVSEHIETLHDLDIPVARSPATQESSTLSGHLRLAVALPLFRP